MHKRACPKGRAAPNGEELVPEAGRSVRGEPPEPIEEPPELVEGSGN